MMWQEAQLSRCCSRCWDSTTCEPLDTCQWSAELHIFPLRWQ